MDYKFIFVIILIIIIIYFLITKELDTFKKDLSDKCDDMIQLIDQNSNLIKNKIQNESVACVNKIRMINGEYIELVRKMNNYGAQPITNMSDPNCFTDSESHCNNIIGGHNNIKYLSDMRDDNKNSSSKHKSSLNDSFYMSETDKHDVKNNEFVLKYHENSDKESIISSKHKSDLKKTKSSLIINDNNNYNLSHTSLPTSTSSKSNTKITTDSSKSTTISISENIPSKYTHSESDKKKSNKTESDKTKSDKTKSDKKESDKTESNKKESDKKKSDKNTENTENTENNTVNTKETSHSSNFGEITLGSFIKKGVKPSHNIKIEPKHTKKINIPDDDNDDNHSVATADISGLTIDTLKSKEEYNLTYLKQIAKRLSIPITCKDGDTRKNLKKEELYDKIKELLTENDTNKNM